MRRNVPKVRLTDAEAALYRRAARVAEMDFSTFTREALREKTERMRVEGKLS